MAELPLKLKKKKKKKKGWAYYYQVITICTLTPAVKTQIFRANPQANLNWETFPYEQYCN